MELSPLIYEGLGDPHRKANHATDFSQLLSYIELRNKSKREVKFNYFRNLHKINPIINERD